MRKFTISLAAVLYALLVFATITHTHAAVEDDVAAAVTFWEARNNASKLQYWRDIHAALVAGEVSDELMDRVTASFGGARVGGRMYTTWKGVYDRFVELRASPPANPQDPDPEEPVLEFTLDIEIPDVQPDNAPTDLVTLASEENAVQTSRPAWFNPGGGYTKAEDQDGHRGWRESQWGEVSDDPGFDYTEDRCNSEGACTIGVPLDAFPGVDCVIEPNKCKQVWNPDGIPDWTYYSYEDAQVNEDYPGRNYATLGWGPWDDLPADVQQAVNDISLLTYAEMADVMNAAGTGDGWALKTLTGTATYSGDATGVFRPDLFGTVYGTRDNPDTAENEYDDAGPRISLTVDFSKRTLDGELTARMTAQRLGFGPPVKFNLDEHAIPDHRFHSAHSHFFSCPNSTCAETYTAVRGAADPSSRYSHGRIETTVSPDAMLRTPVVRWNGVRMIGSDHAYSLFEGQGLYGRFIATCNSGNGASCVGHSDSAAAIAGYINHPRFVGSYLAPKEQQ